MGAVRGRASGGYTKEALSGTTVTHVGASVFSGPQDLVNGTLSNPIKIRILVSLFVTSRGCRDYDSHVFII